MFQLQDLAWLQLDTILKSTLLFMGIYLSVVLLRKLIWKGERVHEEHRLWLFLLLAMFALPIVSLAAPRFRIALNILPPTLAEPAELETRTHVDFDLEKFEPWGDVPSATTEFGIIEIPEKTASSNKSDSDSDSSTTTSTRSAKPEQRPASDLAETIPAVSPQENVAARPDSTSVTLFETLLDLIPIIWLFGSLLLLVRLSISLVLTRRLLRASKIVEAIDAAGYDFSSMNIRVLENSSVTSPIVVGCFRHSIILPGNWRNWTTAKLNSVLAHEISHVRRWDGLVSFGAEINCIINWLNPFSWIVRRKLSRLAEYSCDQAAIGSNGDRLRYARHLLEIASSNRNSIPNVGIAMAARSDIGKRIERILNATHPFSARNSKWFLTLLLLIGTPTMAALAVVQPTARTSPQDETKVELGPPMDGHQWFQAEGDKMFLCYRLTVVYPDGSIAKDATVRARAKNEFKVVNRGDYFEFKYEIKPGFTPGIRVLAKSADGNMIGILTNSSDAMTHDAKNGLTVTLAPATEIQVRVVDDGDVVPNATVGVDWTGGFDSLATSDEDGIARFKLASGTRLSKVGVRTDDNRMGGYQFNRKPVRDPLALFHEVELHPCRGRKIRVTDSAGKPIPELEFELHVSDAKNYNFIPLFDKGFGKTNQQGEAFIDWFPDWQRVHAYLDFKNAEKWHKVQKEEFQNGVLVCQLEKNKKLERIKVSGRVQMPPGLEHSFLVKLGSFEHPEENRYDSLYVRTDPRGYFSADVMPGATYCAFIVDEDWVSGYWADIPFDLKSGKQKQIELKLVKGEPVEIIATYGPNRKPLADLQLSLRQGHSFDWFEDDKRESGSLGRQWWVKTDKNGKALTYANLGEISAWVNQPDWRPEVETKVVAGVPTRIEFHRKSPGRRTIAGVVTVDKSANISVKGLQVRLFPLDGESRDEAVATTDNEGRFQARLSAAIIGATVRSDDGKWFSASIFDDPESGLKLKLNSTANYQGVFLDEDGKPAVDKWVRIEPQLRNEALKDSSRFASAQASLSPVEARTDASGKFTIPGVPYGIPLNLRCQDLKADTVSGAVQSQRDRGIYLGTRFLTRGENRPPEYIQRSDQKKAAPPKFISDYVDQKLLDCRLMGARLLVILQGPGDESSGFITRHLMDTDEIPELMHFLPPVWFNGPNSIKSADRKKFFEKNNWEVPGENELLLCVLDSNGNEVDRKVIDVVENTAIQDAKTFLEDNIGKQQDAETNFQQALATAAAQGKKVWVRLSQTRCGPCYRFGRWIERNRTELEKGFVFLKVDNITNKNGNRIVKRLIGDKHFGIPYHLILDSNGKQVINSEGPLGNIGHPTSFEGISHLKKMLATTSVFSKEQIDRLANDARKK